MRITDGGDGTFWTIEGARTLIEKNQGLEGYWAASKTMIQSIREYNTAKNVDQQAQFIGDKSKSEAKDILLASVLFDYTSACTKLIGDLEAGGFGSIYTMNLSNNGVRLLDPVIPVSTESTQRVARAQGDRGWSDQGFRDR